MADNMFEKLNLVMLPMNLSFWKELQEEFGGGMVSASAACGGAGVATGMGALGAAPCPAMGQITGGSISGALFNGIPVEGTSAKPKKKKKAKKLKEDKQVFYHGSNEVFTEFDKSKIKENKLGLCFNFTDDYDLAYSHGNHIIKAELDLKNPITYETLDQIFPYNGECFFAELLGLPELSKEEYEEYQETYAEMLKKFKMKLEFIRTLQYLGFDGYAFPDEHIYGVFEPEQIHIIDDLNSLVEQYITRSELEQALEDEIEKEELADAEKFDLEVKGLVHKAQAEENDAITSYIDKAMRCEELGIPALAKLFRELADDETVHTGCLQSALDNLGLADYDKMIDGQAEGDEFFAHEYDKKVEEQIESLLNEDFHEEYDEITAQIAKYLDRLNFKYANTDDIIYKKEGEFKYLFKFDNGEGIIKVKVLKDDEILAEKEYKIEETQDIQPIFDEISELYAKYGI